MPENIRPTIASVDLDKLRHNAAVVRASLPEGVRILAAVKGDAYGHGAISCARALSGAGVDWFGVALVEEGRALRAAGIEEPILCLGGIGHAGAEEAVSLNLTPLIGDLDEAQRIDSAARAAGVRVSVHLKLDTGMGRLGVALHDWGHFLDRLADLQALDVQGIATHLSESEGNVGSEAEVFTQEQARRFDEAVVTAKRRGVNPTLIHISNSGAILGHPGLTHDMVRPGLLLYGYSPNGPQCSLELKPVMSVSTQVLVVRDLPAGVGLSYGRTFRTTRPSRIAILPLGYADGYPRALSDRAQVLVHGHLAPIRGKICMDLCMVDVTDVPHPVHAGDEVVLLGSQGDQQITAWDLAAWADTIPYEILSRFSARIPRQS